jgi:cysteine desulfurase family protein
MIYLDNAATSWPKPESVYRTMDDFLRTKGGNPGRGSNTMALAAGEAVEETRRLVARLINAPEANRIIFTLNCTDALNLGLKGLLKPGDHVITDSIGHNSLVRPLRKLEQNGIKVTRVLPSPDTGFISPLDIEAAIIGDTRLIAVTHASNVNGVIQPIEEYGFVARKHNIAFMVDAAQTAGKYPIDVEASNIDLLAFSGHKGLFGPPGTGVLFIGSRVNLDTVREGGTGSFSEQEEQPEILPDKYESGTINSVGIAGLGAGLKFIFDESLDKIIAHEIFFTGKLIAGLRDISGVALYLPKDLSQMVPVVSFNIKGYQPGEVGTILDQAFDIKVRAGLQCAPVAHKTLGTFPSGTVRLSPGYLNLAEEIEFTVKAVERIAGSRNPAKYSGNIFILPGSKKESTNWLR